MEVMGFEGDMTVICPLASKLLLLIWVGGRELLPLGVSLSPTQRELLEEVRRDGCGPKVVKGSLLFFNAQKKKFKRRPQIEVARETRADT